MPIVSRRDFLERSAALAAAGFVPRLPDALYDTPSPVTDAR